MDECIIQAENASSVFDQVMFYTLSSTPEVGLRIGLDDVKCERFCFVYLYIRVCHNVCQLLEVWCCFCMSNLINSKVVCCHYLCHRLAKVICRPVFVCLTPSRVTPKVIGEFS